MLQLQGEIEPEGHSGCVAPALRPHFTRRELQKIQRLTVTAKALVPNNLPLVKIAARQGKVTKICKKRFGTAGSFILTMSATFNLS